VRGPSRGAGFYLAVIAALLVVGGIGGTVAAKLARPSATPTTTAAVTGVGMASPGQHAVANGASTVAPTATIIGIPTVEITDNAPASTAVGR
jgi:hypothetical protein